MPQDRYSFGRHDRITIQGATYRYVARVKLSHVLQLVTDGEAPSGHHVILPDDEVAQLFRERKIRVDEDFFSHAARVARANGAGSDLLGLSDEEIRTVRWKVEWCERFESASAGRDGERAPRTQAGLLAFIEENKVAMNAWHVAEFGAARPVGKLFAGQPRKPFDYPSPSTLRDWLARYEENKFRQDAFRPLYANCGNRNQMDPRAVPIVERNVPRFGSRAAPTVGDVYALVEEELDRVNRGLSPEARVYVSERAVRRRVRRLPPIFVEAARIGVDRAARKYLPVGAGLRTGDGITALDRMQRVEMDDWEMDLFSILADKEVWNAVTPKAKAAAKKLKKEGAVIRCTLTAAIDVATKCIVGLSVSPFAPSPAGSKTALRSLFADKTAIAKWAGAQSDWPMCARPGKVATDGGPAFGGDFHNTLIGLGIEHTIPGQDPRSRGTIESFFRVNKRFCRKFTGQAFSNVVERGDYPAQEMASLLVEDLQRLMIRFIADDYHHRPHEGLGKVRPYTAWQHATNDLAPPPDHVQLMVAFGMPLGNRRVAADGVTYLHVNYVHPKMGVLHGLVGNAPLTIVVDPYDMGTILVRVPGPAGGRGRRRAIGSNNFPDLRERLEGEGDYMVFVAEDFSGITVATHLRNNRAVLDFAREEEEEGRPFRLGVHRELMRAAEDARRRAGLPSEEFGTDQYARFVASIERQGQQVIQPPVMPKGPARDLARERSSGLGRSVASAAPKRAGDSGRGRADRVIKTRSINVREGED